jgi:hypothetical protein
MQTIDAERPSWEKTAEDFAKAKEPFVIVNFSYGRHFIFYELLREKYRLKTSIDRSAKRAFMSPV